MINASQAYQASLMYKKSKVANEIDRLKKAISEATLKGETRTSCYGNIGVETRRILANLGYRISFSSSNDGIETIIEWSKE